MNKYTSILILKAVLYSGIIYTIPEFYLKEIRTVNTQSAI